MARYDRQNPDARNFGLRSRDMASAGRNALREGMRSYRSIDQMSQRFNQFAEYSKNILGISDMRKLEPEHIHQYAAHLHARYEQGEISPATAQVSLSAVNRVIEIARGDNHLKVAPVADAGLPRRSGICTESKAVSVDQHNATVNDLPERLAAQIEMQRELGLRFEESCKINANQALDEAERRGSVTVVDGTKGGRHREVPINTDRQIHSLQKASEIQGRWRSMIPENQTYIQYSRECYREVRDLNFNFHGERHAYAQSRYEAITGEKCPVASGIEHGRPHHEFLAKRMNISVSEARELDHAARLQIAEELGHGRIDVTNHYLG